MIRFPVVLALWLVVCASTFAQIQVPAHSRIGEPLVASTEFEAKVYDWESSTGAKVVSVDGGKRVFIWAREGKHTLRLTAVTESFELKKWTAEFTVDDSPEPPTPATLRDLVSAAEAVKLAEYFRDFAKQIVGYTSEPQFWKAYEATIPVKGNAALDSALRKRLEGPVAKKQGLSIELLAIADEFGKAPSPVPDPPKPDPPIVESGKRQIFVSYESAACTPESGSRWVQLQSGTSAKYLKDHGHPEPVILDDELIPSTKWGAIVGSQIVNDQTTLFIIDPKTNAILFKQAITPDTTADNIIERLRENGG